MAQLLEKIKSWGSAVALGISIISVVLTLGVRFSDTGLDAHFYKKLEDPVFVRAVEEIVIQKTKDLATKQDIEHLSDTLKHTNDSVDLLLRLQIEKGKN